MENSGLSRRIVRCPACGVSQLKPGAQAPGSLIAKKTRFGVDMLQSSNGNGAANPEENEMSWKTPKIVEVPVGMEINMYACAARK
ncbi:pyrroloquinoline quinone precursor peptide PqqA [Bradyrhizobium sp. Ash2021]|nr:pyrroloquinoline quinone precursor peptide PqqA [Bradyrhizobium sp. Ash2021]